MTLTARLEPYGITTGQVWQALPEGGGANRRGFTREAVMAAVERACRKPAEIEA
jgi:S-DNA-T family DNA segregation ATPase FtsK/SpoIIIE